MPSDFVTAIAVLGVIVGVILRTYLPYLKAAAAAEKAGVPITFAPKFTATAILSAIGAIFFALEALSVLTIPDAEGIQGILTVFLGSLTFAVAFQSTINLFAEK